MIQVLISAEAASVSVAAVGALAAGIGCAAGARDWWRRSIAQGQFASGASLCLVGLMWAFASPAAVRPATGIVLLCLAIAWTVAGARSLRLDSGRAQRGDALRLRARRAEIWFAAAAICAAIGLARLSGQLESGGVVRSLGLPAAAACFFASALAMRGAVPGAATLLAASALTWWLASDSPQPLREALSPAAALVVALAMLAAALAPAVARWLFRRRAWLSNPYTLLEPAAELRWLRVANRVAAFGFLAFGILTWEHPLTPVTVWIASLASFVIAHRGDDPASAAAALALLALGTALAPVAWVGGGSAVLMTGVAMAGLWLLWLARFWRQQLLDERAWTTAGRLIPIARFAACLVAPVGLVIALGALDANAISAAPLFTALAGLTHVGLALYLFRDARDEGGAAARAAACVAALAGSVPLWRLASWCSDLPLPPVTALVIAAFVLVLRGRPAGCARALALGAMPVLALGSVAAYGLVWSDAGVLALGCAAIATAWARGWFARSSAARES
ncbi:MAG: hypothetical protein HRF50_03600 [Phycisphaerae bacterium]|jgi:hypothetical protein